MPLKFLSTGGTACPASTRTEGFAALIVAEHPYELGARDGTRRWKGHRVSSVVESGHSGIYSSESAMSWLNLLRRDKSASSKLTLQQATAMPFAALPSAKAWREKSAAVPANVVAFAEQTVPFYQIALFLVAFEEKYGRDKIDDLRTLLILTTEYFLEVQGRQGFEQFLAIQQHAESARQKMLSARDADASDKLKFMIEESSPMMLFEYWLAEMLLAQYQHDLGEGGTVAAHLTNCFVNARDVSLAQYREILNSHPVLT
jgi:hypothetical protein